MINAASRLFREHGFDGIGLKDLMRGAGLTQGGFYKQFESKDDLAALASRRAMESATRRWSSVAASSKIPLEAVADLYLSAGHRGETSRKGHGRAVTDGRCGHAFADHDGRSNVQSCSGSCIERGEASGFDRIGLAPAVSFAK